MNKYKKYKLVVYCLVALLIGQPARAAGQQLTVEECIAMGLKNDFSFHIQSLKIKQLEATKRSSVSRLLPVVSGNFNHQYDLGSSIDPNTNNRVAANFQSDNMSVNARVNLIDFSELWQSRLQQKDIDIAYANKKVIAQEYVYNLIEKYYAALSAQKQTLIIFNQLENTKEQVDRITKEVANGARAESDQYDIQVIYTQEQKLLLTTQQEELNKKQELLQWINNQEINPATLSLNMSGTTNNVAAAVDLENIAKVKFESEMKRKLETEHKSLSSTFLPSVNLGYSFGSFYSKQIENIVNTSFDFGNQLRNNKYQYLGLGIQIPLFNRGDNFRSRKIKNIEIAEQQVRIDKVKQQEKNLYDNCYRNWMQYNQLTKLLHETASYAEKSLETTTSKYEFGQVDISAYRLAKNQLMHSQYDIIANELAIAMTTNLMKIIASQ